MRCTITLLALVALCLRLDAGEQLIIVTPQSLDSWLVTGADKATLASGKQMLLPAGTQLSRQFTGGAVVVFIASKPPVGDTAADYPVLEVGPMAVALVRQNDVGKIVLLVGDKKQDDLLWSVPLAAADQTMQLTLGYDPIAGIGLVGLGGHYKYFDLAPSALPVETMLSAGEKSPWPQDLTRVLLLPNDASENHYSSSSATPSDAQYGSVVRIKAALEKLAGHGISEPSAVIVAASKTGKAAPNNKVYRMEVSTPPAVRHRHVETVRSIVANSQGK